jgi:surfactin synthase thioesterase subunit
VLKAIPFIKAPQLLDKLVTYTKRLSEAAIHAELYRILQPLLRADQIKVLTETKVVESSAMRCDIWMTTQVCVLHLFVI